MDTHRFIKACLSLIAIGFLGASSSPRAHKYQVAVDRQVFNQHLSEIRKANFDVAGVNLRTNKVSLIMTSEEISRLNAMGVTTGRFTRDVSILSPDPKFKTPDQIGQILNKFAADYPDLAAVQSAGKSLQGRDILVLKITAHVGQPNTRPAILFNGMHHAREVMSPEVPLDIAQYLLENYGKNAKVTNWVNNSQIYVMPMLNVDGNNIVWTSDDMWRKNARDGVGVDINRNYPYAWNTCNGSSDDPGADDYRGTAPASEPETNVMMDFVKATHPVFDISFHSYSELVIYPYGCGTHTAPGSLVEPLGQQMASLIVSDDGAGHYTPGLAPDLLYPVDGADIDWMYHDQNVIPYVIELNNDSQGFLPDYDQWRDSTVTRLRPAWQLLLDKLNSSVIQGTARAGARFVRVESRDGSFVQDVMVHADGTFHAVVNPGVYRVSTEGVSATGYAGNRTLELQL